MKLVKRLITILFLTLLSHQVDAAKLKGLIRENDLSGPPLPNVQVAADGANPTASDSQGVFTLDFPQRVAGEIVIVIVKMPGYAVVNYFELDHQVLAKDAGADLRLVILCKPQDWEEMVRRYIRLRDSERVDRCYLTQRRALDERKQATPAALKDLRRQREQAKGAAVMAADEQARKGPIKNRLYVEAMALSATGSADEALSVLQPLELQRSLEEAKRRKADSEQALSEAIQAYLLKAHLLTTGFRFSEAEQTYRAILDLVPSNFDARFAYARFEQALNRRVQALVDYRRCVDLARQAKSDASLAAALNNLGSLYRSQNKYQEAREALDEALQLYRQLALQNPAQYRPDVAMVLNNLGNLLGSEDSADAPRVLEEALGFYRELARHSPEAYLPDVAMALTNLGNVHSGGRNNAAAHAAHDEAIRIYRGLAHRDPDTYRNYLAGALVNFGIVARAEKKLDEARSAYDEAMAIYRELSGSNPEAYLPDLAGTLINSGVLYRSQGNETEAVAAYKEALRIYRSIEPADPEAYQPDLAGALMNLGNLHKGQNRTEEARAAYAEASTIYTKLAKREPERYRADLAKVQRLLSQLSAITPAAK